MFCLKRTLFACLRARARFQRACVCRRVFLYVLISKATKFHLIDKIFFAPAERQNEMRPRRANLERVCKINRFAFEPISKKSQMDTYGYKSTFLDCINRGSGKSFSPTPSCYIYFKVTLYYCLINIILPFICLHPIGWSVGNRCHSIVT